ncbi:MAG: Ig-like domain-containing protein [Acidobacteriota bacterium]
MGFGKRLTNLLAIILAVLLLANIPVIAKTYTYDSQHRIKTVTYDNGMTIEYTYDAAGNIISVKQTGGVNIPVSGITLDKHELAFTTGDPAITLKPTISPTNATNKSVYWNSSNDQVASVSNGLVTPLAKGTSIITVTTTDGGFQDRCTITVSDPHIPVTGVALNKHSLSLLVNGPTALLIPNVIPQEAVDKSVYWTSSNEVVATVYDGVVSPLARGISTITVTSYEGGFKDTCEVNVTGPDSDENTTLLIHMDGDENGTAFSDLKGKAITRAGDTSTKTGVKQIGSAAGYFDGYGDYLSMVDSEDFNVGAQDFTLDFWMRTNTSGRQVIFSQNDYYSSNSSRGLYAEITSDNRVQAGFASESNFNGIISNNQVTWGRFYHLALVRKGNTMMLFIDGKLEGTRDVTGLTANNSTNQFVIGRPGENTNYSFMGYIDEFRLSKGIGRWNSDFTVPSSPYTLSTVETTGVSLDKHTVNLDAGQIDNLTAAVTPNTASNQNVTWSSSNTSVVEVDSNGRLTAKAAGTAEVTVTTAAGNFTYKCTVTVTGSSIDENTTLLIHMDGEENATAFSDLKGKAITRAGDTCTKTGVKQIGSAAGYFDGYGDYLSMADSEDFNVGAQDFTLDFWLKISTSGRQVIFGQNDYYSSNSSRGLYGEVGYDNRVQAGFASGSNFYGIMSSTQLITSKFYHLALVRKGNTMMLFVDGKLEGIRDVTGLTANNSTNQFVIGRPGEKADYYLMGYIDEFRLSKGIGRWNSDFTLPNSPYTLSTVETTGVSLDKHTLSLSPTQTDKLTAVVSPNTASNQAVTWNSSNTSVVEVDSNGRLTAKAAGTVEITVTTSAGNFIDKCTVTVVAP